MEHFLATCLIFGCLGACFATITDNSISDHHHKVEYNEVIGIIIGLAGHQENNGRERNAIALTSTSDEACYECQSIAHFIQTELYDYQKEKEIDDWVIRRICSKVVSVIGRETCESFTEEYGPAILQLIAMQVFDPKGLCEKQLKLCPPTKHSRRYHKLRKWARGKHQFVRA
ncbi:hypothetical protein HDE_13763 [Halotydeus destructor]|nr:hypothetical protein HDE_13763 [Halotydeus destructor]